MQNKKSVLLIILVVAALFSLVYGITTPSKAKRAISSEPIPKREDGILQVEGTTRSERDFKRSNFDLWGRSPFLPKGFGEEAPTGLVLRGITWDPKTPRAVINDSIVGVGSEVTGSKVVAIKENSVVLNDGTQDFELRLGQKK